MGIGYGRVEDKPFEQLMADLAEWFIDNPLPRCREQQIEFRPFAVLNQLLQSCVLLAVSQVCPVQQHE